MMRKIISVVGARPNFIKVAPLHRAFQNYSTIESKIVHTGQHYDKKMSDIFFNQLGLPKPDFHLGIGGGTHTYQKANVMLAFEETLIKEKPDIVLVVGDVNATSACAIVAVKMGITTVHVEAGLRSGDRTMPEEVNRVITDAICDHLFVTEHSGLVNLAREGVSNNKMHFVGNVMIDSLMLFREKAQSETMVQDLNLPKKGYALMTMHRPHNVDNESSLRDIIQIAVNTANQLPLVFPLHPRTENNLKKFNLYAELLKNKNLYVLGPQGYLQFLHLMDNAQFIITDSGGIQEETTYLQVPCLTFRDTTERPITIELGTNTLMSDLNPTTVNGRVKEILIGDSKIGVIPPLWDGKTSDRIANILTRIPLK